MKTIKLLLIILSLILTGCSDNLFENMPFEEPSAEYKKAVKEKAVTIKVHARLSASANFELPPVVCNPEQYNVMLAGGGWIDGYATLLGNVNRDSSTFIRTNCALGPGPSQLTSYGKCQMMGSNGDKYFIDVVEVADMATMTFTGYVDITDGTGKFKGATGHIEMINGTFDELGNARWTGYGEIILKKK